MLVGSFIEEKEATYLVFPSSQEREHRNQGERRQGKKWNRDEPKPIDVLHIARDTADAWLDSAEALDFLLQIVQKGDDSPDDRHGQDDLLQTCIQLECGHSENQGKRVHEDPLEPA